MTEAPKTESQLRFRLRYDLLPVLDGSEPANKRHAILVARTGLGDTEASRLAVVQYAKWYCEDVGGQKDLAIELFVPRNAEAVHSALQSCGVEYQTAPELDENDVTAIADLAQVLDCDTVITVHPDRLNEVFPDEIGVVGAEIADALHSVEIHMKGFGVPWSFEFPSKNMPWSNFYIVSEPHVFKNLLTELAASSVAGPEVAEVMRSLVADAIPALCFSRDRLEFFRQQERRAQRHGLEHQDFSMEYAVHLNHFYLTYYAAVDQVVALVVYLYKMPVPKHQIGATYKAFREARRAYPAVDATFSDAAFWSMYDLPQTIRHLAAHTGPVKPCDIYFGAGDYSDAELDQAAEKHDLLDAVRFFEAYGAPKQIVDAALNVARAKALRKLMGSPRRHGVLLKKGKKALYYYPDPSTNLKDFLAFFERILQILRPWGEIKTSRAEIVE